MPTNPAPRSSSQDTAASPPSLLALSDVLDRAFRICRAHVLQFLRPVVLLFMPVLALQVIGATWLAAPPLLIAMLGWIVTVRLSAVALLPLSAHGWRHQTPLPTTPPLWQTSAALRLIGAQLIEALIVSTPIVFLYLYAQWSLPDITDAASEYRLIILTGIGVVITGLVMLWLSVYFWLTPQTIVLEACGPFRGVGRSWALVCRAWWRSCSIGLIIGLFYGIALSSINLTLDALTYLSGEWIAQYTQDTRITRFLLQVGLLPLIPVQHTITTLLYLDLRKQRDAIRATAPSRQEA